MLKYPNGQPYDGTVKFILGLDGFAYAVFDNEYEAEDFFEYLGGVRIACCGGFFNGVMLNETLGM